VDVTAEAAPAASAGGAAPGGVSFEMMEQMLDNPDMLKMLYPTLPEAFRSPEKVKWLLSQPGAKQHGALRGRRRAQRAHFRRGVGGCRQVRGGASRSAQQPRQRAQQRAAQQHRPQRALLCGIRGGGERGA
jgi:hypothetical protein